MDLKVVHEAVTINEVAYSVVTEQAIECDFILPDYYDEILRVLKCNAYCIIANKTLVGEKLMLEGVVTVHVIYVCSEDKGIRSAQYKMPMSKTIDLRESYENPVVKITLKTDYVNCRVLNPRRLDIRGAVSVGVKVYTDNTENIISDAQGDGVQLKKRPIRISTSMGEVSKQFSVRDTLEPEVASNIAYIINSGASVDVTDLKVITGKVVMKGSLDIKLFYQDSDGLLQKSDISVPISQIVDAQGVDEDSECLIDVKVQSCDLELVDDDDGGKMIKTDVALELTADIHNNIDTEVITDAYSTKYEVLSQSRIVPMRQLVKILSEDYTAKLKTAAPESGINEIVDAWCSVNSVVVDLDLDAPTIRTKVAVCVLAIEPGGEPVYLERVENIDYKMENIGDTDEISVEPIVDIKSISYTMDSEEQIDFRIHLSYKGCVYTTLKEKMIYEIDINKETPKEYDDSVSLTIYYADVGESIWDIAKRFNTSVSQIMSENEIDSEIISHRKMILIPIVN